MLRKLSGLDPVLVVMIGAVLLALTCSLILRSVVGPRQVQAESAAPIHAPVTAASASAVDANAH